MQKKIILTFSIAGLLALWCSCGTENANTASSVDTTETNNDQAAIDTVTGQKSLWGAKGVLDQPVDPRLHRPAVNAYRRSPAIKNTEYVKFMEEPLKKWMTKIHDSVDYDNVRISFAIYTKEILLKYRKPLSWEGRMTVFIEPFLGSKYARYKKDFPAVRSEDDIHEGDSIKPYNMGEIYP